jgi:hypothetical protein
MAAANAMVKVTLSAFADQRLGSVAGGLPGISRLAGNTLYQWFCLTDVIDVVRVIVRGKARADVEIGNTVSIWENCQGIILDHQMFRLPREPVQPPSAGCEATPGGRW